MAADERLIEAPSLLTETCPFKYSLNRSLVHVISDERVLERQVPRVFGSLS